MIYMYYIIWSVPVIQFIESTDSIIASLSFNVLIHRILSLHEYLT